VYVFSRLSSSSCIASISFCIRAASIVDPELIVANASGSVSFALSRRLAIGVD